MTGEVTADLIERLAEPRVETVLRAGLSTAQQPLERARGILARAPLGVEGSVGERLADVRPEEGDRGEAIARGGARARRLAGTRAARLALVRAAASVEANAPMSKIDAPARLQRLICPASLLGTATQVLLLRTLFHSC